eukprot:15100105-Alexandrium_andersonii.AAC.1
MYVRMYASYLVYIYKVRQTAASDRIVPSSDASEQDCSDRIHHSMSTEVQNMCGGAYQSGILH